MTDERSQTGFLARAERVGQLLESAALVSVLAAMVLLATAQIVLRNFMDSGLAWGDEALRLMVLWVAMLGAVAASRENRHIAIDALSRILPQAPKAWATVVVHAFTAAVAFTLAWYAWEFVADSREYEDLLLGDLPACGCRRCAKTRRNRRNGAHHRCCSFGCRECGHAIHRTVLWYVDG